MGMNAQGIMNEHEEWMGRVIGRVLMNGVLMSSNMNK